MSEQTEALKARADKWLRLEAWQVHFEDTPQLICDLLAHVEKLEAENAALHAEVTRLKLVEEAHNSLYVVRHASPVQAEPPDLSAKATELVSSVMRCMTCGTAAFVPNERCKNHISARDAFETERTMHNAWRKRGEEAEAREAKLEADHAALREALEGLKAERQQIRDDMHARLPESDDCDGVAYLLRLLERLDAALARTEVRG